MLTYEKIAVLGALIAWAGCCLHRIDIDAFQTLPLSAQIVQFEEARRQNCVTSEHLALLSAMSLHGYESAAAMTDLLISPNDGFPFQDVVTVLEFTHNRGTDLRRHRAIAELSKLSETSTDAALRHRAKVAMDKLKMAPPPPATK